MKKYYRLLRLKFHRFINNPDLPLIPFLFIWHLIDIVRRIKKRDDREIHLHGIYGFFGLYGGGKTIGMTRELYRLRKKYGNDIYIFTNYGFKLEDRSFYDWKMLLHVYDKPAIFAWDEVQNEFNSRNFKSFPTELLTLLTQNRKGNGIRLYYTAQRWARVDKVFRELTTLCAECKSRIPRFTSVRWYHWEEYEQLTSTTNVDSKMKVKSRKRDMFIQTDMLRNLYDSYQMLDSAKNKEYLDREVINKLTS